MKFLSRQPYIVLCGVVAAAVSVAPACASAPQEPTGVDNPSTAKTIKVQGQLTSGVECPAMKADNGTTYTLLGDLKGFKLGDRVIIEGRPVEVSTCMQGTTLQIVQIGRP